MFEKIPDKMTPSSSATTAAAGSGGGGRGGVAIARVEMVVESGVLSVKGAHIVRRHVNQRGDGHVTFGELAVLTRQGASGLLGARDCEALVGGLMEKPSPTIAERLRDGPSSSFSLFSPSSVLSSIRIVFNQYAVKADPSSSATATGGRGGGGRGMVVPWEMVRGIASEMCEREGIGGIEAERAVRQIRKDPPSASDSVVDFERL